MNVQRKKIHSGQIDPITLLEALTVDSMGFGATGAVNIHGVNITLGVSPGGDDEIMRGRWYVVLLPQSIENNSTVRNEWIDQLDNHSSANSALSSSEFVWASGSFACASNSPFQMTFSPKTSRNAQLGAVLRVIVVADGITGILDAWEASAMISLFTSA